MTTRTLTACGVILAALLAGCAQRRVGDPAMSAPPTTAELPAFPELQRTIPAVVAVEGQSRFPRRQILPDFTPPELTEEERAVVQRGVPDFRFLPYNVLSIPPGSSVGTWYGGLVTEAHGHGLPSVALAEARYVGAPGHFGGVLVAADPLARYVGAVYDRRASVATVGPEDVVQVGADPRARQVAERKSRYDQ